ncbi:MAG: DegT/DnrJ/EryC1/StrS family aminotransferase [Planctomycetia bacterium]|nr:DegT/DnrJ/EryC1/StrS family aminotransferase [Planctomycetia bacterium]
MKEDCAVTEETRTSVSPVPLLDLSRQYAALREEMNEALRRVNDSGQFVLGPEVKRLEAGIAEYSHTAFGVGCASGSDALLLALMAAGIGPGDEVIVPSFTFFATASCVPRLGATPVFADIDPVTFNIDPQHVEKLITSRTKAIIPVHLYGQMADMTALRAMTKEHSDPLRQKIVLVEDAAQAIGAELNGVRAGNWGDMTCLSFYPTKNLGGAGDGGMVITNDESWSRQVRLLRGHGMEPRYFHKVIGINSRLDSYQAAVLNVKLPHLDAWSEMRAANAKRYEVLFAEAGLTRILTLPQALPHHRHVWNQYVIRIPDGHRDAVRAALSERKIGSDIYYPMGLHEQECFAWLGYEPHDLPETWKASQEVLALPIYPELREEEQWTVVKAFKEYFAASAR